MEYDLTELAELLNKSEEEMKKLVNDLLLSGLLEKNGEKFKLTTMGNNFMRFISGPSKN